MFRGKKKKHKKDRNKRSSFVLVSVAAILTVTVIAIGTLFVGSGRSRFLNSTSNKTYDKVSTTNTVDANTNDSKTKVTTTKSDSSSSSTNEAVVTDVSAVVEEVMPSIVAITSTSIVESGFSNDWYDYYFGYGNGNDGGTYEETGAGSGIIIGQSDSELLIVTNNHVVEGADSLQVQFIDEETVDAAIKGTDSSNDLAVVAVKLEDIPEDTMKEIKVATIGDSDALKVGEGTIAIGNALGYGQSVTTGVVSALNREVEYEDGSKKDLIQTDAAINPGNSGGALLNMKGEVIGINAAKYSSSSVEGMGFAIPISNVEDIINKLMNEKTKEKVDDEERGYLNINGRDITSTMSEEYNIPVGVYVVNVTKGGAADKAGLQENSVIVGIEGKTCTLYMSKVNNVPQGMLVTKIDKDGPAASTELKANDIITEINGEKITSSVELIDELKKYKPEDIVTFKVYRPSKDKSAKGYEFSVKIKLKADTGTEK